jgi:hypothetical protein
MQVKIILILEMKINNRFEKVARGRSHNLFSFNVFMNQHLGIQNKKPFFSPTDLGLGLNTPSA